MLCESLLVLGGLPTGPRWALADAMWDPTGARWGPCRCWCWVLGRPCPMPFEHSPSGRDGKSPCFWRWCRQSFVAFPPDQLLPGSCQSKKIKVYKVEVQKELAVLGRRETTEINKSTWMAGWLVAESLNPGNI